MCLTLREHRPTALRRSTRSSRTRGGAWCARPEVVATVTSRRSALPTTPAASSCVTVAGAPTDSLDPPSAAASAAAREGHHSIVDRLFSRPTCSTSPWSRSGAWTTSTTARSATGWMSCSTTSRSMPVRTRESPACARRCGCSRRPATTWSRRIPCCADPSSAARPRRSGPTIPTSSATGTTSGTTRRAARSRRSASLPGTRHSGMPSAGGLLAARDV
jgi:hypothetical protein